MADDPTVPPQPVNPFVGGGAETNVDKQRALLNDLIAQEGQFGKDIYARQGSDAQAALAQRLAAAGPVPDARKAVYDAFVRDQAAAEAQQARTLQRQAAIGNAFMEQTKAAVPLLATTTQATTDAMRAQFEERRRREQEQADLERQRIQASLASSRASNKSAADRGREKAEEELAYNQAMGITNEARMTPEEAEKRGIARPQSTLDDAVKSLKLPPWDALKKSSKGLEEDVNYLQTAVNAAARKKGKDAWTFDEVVSELNNLAATDETLQTSDRGLLVDLVLAANAGRWGVTDPAEWGYDPSRYNVMRENYGRSAGRV